MSVGECLKVQHKSNSKVDAERVEVNISGTYESINYHQLIYERDFADFLSVDLI